MELFDFQKNDVARMIDLEKNRNEVLTLHHFISKDKYGILCEPTGAGKTTICLSLIKETLDDIFLPHINIDEIIFGKYDTNIVFNNKNSSIVIAPHSLIHQ